MNINLKIKKSAIVLLLTILLFACDNNNADENDNLTIDTNNSLISANETQSKKALKDAINSLNNVKKEFQWRDTYLIIQESQYALSNGKFQLSIELAQKVMAQTTLMNEQKDFADNHWKSLIPIGESK